MHLVTINILTCPRKSKRYVVIGRTSEELINLAMDEFRKEHPSVNISSVEVARINNTSKVLKYTP